MRHHRPSSSRILKLLLVAVCHLSFIFLCPASATRAQNLTFQEIEKLPVPPADRRIAYGSDPLQFGELRLPHGQGKHPLVIVIHGGCWYAEYNLTHIANFSAALAREGVATWSIEYRRIGDAGGGWPGTFEDVARGADYVRTLARAYPLDLRRVVVVGHSAGGQLALWLAARGRLPKESTLYAPDPVALRGVVSLAGIADMREFGARCGGAVAKLLGGSPDEVATRYAQTSPSELLPLGVRQRLVHGALDSIVPLQQSRDYEAAARRAGDDVRLTVIEKSGHFDLIAPGSEAWPAVKQATLSLLKIGKSRRRQMRQGSTHGLRALTSAPRLKTARKIKPEARA